jgi:Zn ribbon nucleic-acid-binding protein
MEKEQVKIYFEDLSINSNYQLLEWGKDDDELTELAIKKGMEVPSKDLAFFKCVYAMVDKANKNKCTLPRKEVKKALKSLNGKAIDKDHLRKATIGHWIHAELDGEDIIAYGCFWKSNFPDDYEIIKEKMTEGEMKVSFEAWGDRVFKAGGGYDLVDIHFCGGALLFDTNPAFPDADVLDFASARESGVLEFAKIIEEGSFNCECIKCGYKETSEEHCKDKKCPKCGAQMRREERPGTGDPDTKGEEKVEVAKFNFIPEDCSVIDKFLWETACPSCETKGMYSVSLIDFSNSIAKANCIKCGAKYHLNLEPEVTLEKKGKKIKEMTLSSEKVNKGGSSKMDEYLKKYNKSTAEEVVSFLEAEIEAAKTSKGDELENLKIELEKAKVELEKAKLEATDAKEKLDTKMAEEKAALVKARKDELGEEFAKDISDEDILNDLKFELAKTKKELADVKTEKATKKEETGMEAGASSDTEPVFEKQKSINSRAFGK